MDKEKLKEKLFNEEKYDFKLDDDNEFEMTLDEALDMHMAMRRGADKLISQIAVHSFMLNMREEFEETIEESKGATMQ